MISGASAMKNSGDGILATYTFTVKESASVDFTVTQSDFYDKDGKTLKCDVHNAGIKVEEPQQDTPTGDAPGTEDPTTDDPTTDVPGTEEQDLDDPDAPAGEDEPAAIAFNDVPISAYYYDAVAWAVANGVTGGTSVNTFSPDASCTRAQLVTFLWRVAGCTQTTAENSFADVKSKDYYNDAVTWAVAKGITKGVSADKFALDAAVTRAQTVTLMWCAAGSPNAAAAPAFNDVKAGAYYTDAVAWAVEQGITKGMTKTAFAPEAPCARGQIVCFLYRNAVR